MCNKFYGFSSKNGNFLQYKLEMSFSYLFSKKQKQKQKKG